MNPAEFAKQGIETALNKSKIFQVILQPLDLSRAELVAAEAPLVAGAIVNAHKNSSEALAHLDYVQRVLKEADSIIRKTILESMDGSFELDAYDGQFRISRVRLPVKYEYPSPEHTALVAKIAEYKAMLKDLEDGMKKAGQAVAQTDQEYTLKLSECKLTMKGREVK